MKEPSTTLLVSNVEAIRKQYREDELSEEETLRHSLDLLSPTWPSEAFACLRELDPSSKMEIFDDIAPVHDFAVSNAPSRCDYLCKLLTLCRDVSIVMPSDVGSLLRMAATMLDSNYPVLSNVVDVTNGSGSSAIIHAATEAQTSRRIIAKTDRFSLVTIKRGDDAVVQGLEPYGGPSFLGEAAFYDDHGVMRYAVCMELVPGFDLQRLVHLSKRGEMLPYPVTEKHLSSLLALQDKLASEGKSFSEVNLGDFMLIPDGQIAPLDMYVVARDDPHQGLSHYGVPVSDYVQQLL